MTNGGFGYENSTDTAMDLAERVCAHREDGSPCSSCVQECTAALIAFAASARPASATTDNKSDAPSCVLPCALCGTDPEYPQRPSEATQYLEDCERDAKEMAVDELRPAEAQTDWDRDRARSFLACNGTMTPGDAQSERTVASLIANVRLETAQRRESPSRAEGSVKYAYELLKEYDNYASGDLDVCVREVLRVVGELREGQRALIDANGELAQRMGNPSPVPAMNRCGNTTRDGNSERRQCVRLSCHTGVCEWEPGTSKAPPGRTCKGCGEALCDTYPYGDVHANEVCRLKAEIAELRTETIAWSKAGEQGPEDGVFAAMPNACAALAACIAAMKKSVDVGCTEHLDADDDHGTWWYAAIEAGEAALRGSSAPSSRAASDYARAREWHESPCPSGLPCPCAECIASLAALLATVRRETIEECAVVADTFVTPLDDGGGYPAHEAAAETASEIAKALLALLKRSADR